VKTLSFQVRVPPKHFPILVARDESDVFDRKAGFKKPARAFMAKVMKV
jgi:hypothetical protein